MRSFSDESPNSHNVDGRSLEDRRPFLDAAEEVIAEVGYDATTMQSIAFRAHASVEDLRRYFPNIQSIVLALRSKYGLDLEHRFSRLAFDALGGGIPGLIDDIFAILRDVIAKYPAFIPIQAAPQHFRREESDRNRLRERLATIFININPALTPQESFFVACVMIDTMKAMSGPYADGLKRSEVIVEFKRLLADYLVTRLV